MTIMNICRWSAEQQRRVKKLLISSIINIVLLLFVFIFIYPYFYMIINSLKYEVDLMDPGTQWILTRMNFGNYSRMLQAIDFFGGISTTIMVSSISAVGQVLSCSIIGYGLARYKFKGNNIIFALIIIALIIPPQVFTIPLYLQYTNIGWIGSVLPIVVPCFFGFGLKGSLFIFIFRQYFIGLPKSYEEAARIEGCGEFRIFSKIIFPIASSSILVSFILSFVWHWNDYFEPTTYLKGETQMLSQLITLLNIGPYVNATASGNPICQPALAACVLSTLPLLIIYAFLQKKFIAGIESCGLAN
jgi:multiple sugar transport system permease protein